MNDMDYKQYPNPPYIQRSTSAPIAENVSDAMLPNAYSYKDEQDPNNPNPPVRRNPRMANSKIFDETQGGANNKQQLTIMNDPGLLSLINESLPRTPMDLIQADFPSTPSAVYSNRIFDGLDSVASDLPDTGDLKVSSGDLRMPDPAKRTSSTNLSSMMSSSSSSSGGGSGSDSNSQLALEQATKSLDQLYVSPELSSKMVMVQQGGQVSQYHSNGRSTSSAVSFFSSNPSSSVNVNVPPHVHSSSSVLSAKQSSAEGLLNGSVPPFSVALNNSFSNNNSLPKSNVPPFNSLLGGSNSNSSPILTPLIMNGSIPGGGMLSINGMQQQQSIQQQQSTAQPAYYVQQAVYLDQNGQPIYYHRPAQEFMYASPAALDGSVQQQQLQGMNGSERLGYYDSQMGGTYSSHGGGVLSMPSVMGSQNSNNQLLPTSMTGYWAPHNQADQSQMQAMYMSTQQQQPMSGVVPLNPNSDVTRRMIFNPATGQYNSVPANSVLLSSNANQAVQGSRAMGYPTDARLGANQLSQIPGQQQGMGYPSMVPGGQGPGMNLPALLPRSQQMNGPLDESMFLLTHQQQHHQQQREEDQHFIAGGGMRSAGHMGGFGEYLIHRDHRSRDSSSSSYRDNNKQSGDRDGSSGGRSHRDRDRVSRSSSSSAGSAVSANPARDSLVEEFRNTYGKTRQWGLRDLIGHAVAFCQDQHGSRFIQQRLEVCVDADKQTMFDEIVPAAQSLVTDVFGNYVLQKLFEYGTPDQCESLAVLLQGQAVQLSMQMYGCRVVQKALEYVHTPRLLELVAEFENPQLLLRCVHDSNGNHVIQKCIEIVSKAAREATAAETSDYLSQRIQFIINAFQGRVKELSSHPYGCRVVQRILEHCSNSQKSVVLEELRQCCTDLVQDCYGNYVIQFVMQHGWEADRAVLIREVQANLLDFSQHKFASNVVEKCLQFASKKDRDEMIWTIINATFDLQSPVDAKGHCVLESMVRDPYANYVVQKVIDVSDERQRGAIMRYVKENISQLRRYTYGKHIIVRLEKITNEKF